MNRLSKLKLYVSTLFDYLDCYSNVDLRIVPPDHRAFSTSSTIASADIYNNIIYINKVCSKYDDKITLSVIAHEVKHIEQYKCRRDFSTYMSSDRFKGIVDYYMQPIELDALCFQEIVSVNLLGFSWMGISKGLDKVCNKVNEMINNEDYYINICKKMKGSKE